MSNHIAAYEKELVHEFRETPKEYWPNLIRIVRLFRQSVSLKPAEESFREGWQEATTGQTLPVSELWEDFYDSMIAGLRADEPRETLDSVKDRLRKQGKLSG